MILVTGGTGFIGSYLIKQLLSSGKSIRAIKRRDSIVPKILQSNSQIEWVEADLLDYFSLQEAFKGVSEVYHCAALVSYRPDDKKRIMQVNVEGTTHIVNLCLDCQAKLVYVSSVAALGENEKGRDIDEKSYWIWSKHTSRYSISKFEAEREVWRGIAEGLLAVIVNPSVVIGVSNGKSESGRIFELLEKGLNLYPSGSAGFVDVNDVATIMVELMSRTDALGKGFILNGRNISYKELFTKYSVLSGNPPPKYRVSYGLMGIAWRIVSLLRGLGIKRFGLTKEIALASLKKSTYSNKKISDALNYSFKPLEESLEEIHASLQ
ncbi:MAG TPA: NAD-dependent epimerase/dehydratase family protein [Sphingobacteriaceae bacterium]|nr:NAD-dependent epimerase/dehydratase family protein [Sphingobacteriaceae bacterium]